MMVTGESEKNSVPLVAVVYCRPRYLHGVVQPAAEHAEAGQHCPVARAERTQPRAQARQREGREAQHHQHGARRGDERRRDVVAHRARHDPVAGPQRERGDHSEIGGGAHRAR
jgi:hypothetical protein